MMQEEGRLADLNVVERIAIRKVPRGAFLFAAGAAPVVVVIPRISIEE
jgi:hypothetical protein